MRFDYLSYRSHLKDVERIVRVDGIPIALVLSCGHEIPAKPRDISKSLQRKRCPLCNPRPIAPNRLGGSALTRAFDKVVAEKAEASEVHQENRMTQKPLENKLKPRLRVINHAKRVGFQVNLSTAEVGLIDAAAARAGLSRAAFLRQAAIEKATS